VGSGQALRLNRRVNLGFSSFLGYIYSGRVTLPRFEEACASSTCRGTPRVTPQSLRTAQLTNVGNPKGTPLVGIQRHDRAARAWSASPTVREQVARTAGFAVRVFSVAIIATPPYSIAASKLRRLFLSERYFFIVMRLLRRREKFTEPDFALLARAFNRARAHHPFHLTAWLFLPDHWHCIRAPVSPVTISPAMKSVKQSSMTRPTSAGAPTANSGNPSSSTEPCAASRNTPKRWDTFTSTRCGPVWSAAREIGDGQVATNSPAWGRTNKRNAAV